MAVGTGFSLGCVKLDIMGSGIVPGFPTAEIGYQADFIIIKASAGNRHMADWNIGVRPGIALQGILPDVKAQVGPIGSIDGIAGLLTDRDVAVITTGVGD